MESWGRTEICPERRNVRGTERDRKGKNISGRLRAEVKNYFSSYMYHFFTGLFFTEKKDKNYTWTDDILKDENPGFFKSFFSKKKA